MIIAICHDFDEKLATLKGKGRQTKLPIVRTVSMKPLRKIGRDDIIFRPASAVDKTGM
jgi:hypothetical protein